MARKKIVFIIVEGPSDEEALGVILSKFFEKDEVHVEIMHCDITTKNGVNSSNIIKEIANVVKNYADRYHFNSSHFKKIIHITDTDGAFCPNNVIKENPSLYNYIYSISQIEVPNKEYAILRNKQKSLNLLKLIDTKEIWKIPYSIYYMSCNLEHVLFDKLNCSDEEKEKLSYKFAKKYKDNIAEFIDYISNSPFSINDDYSKSWNFIKHDTNSLKRYTNLSICLKHN